MAKGYVSPTPIQARAIPDIMIGRDFLGIAQTGSGKTAAFVLPILHRLTINPLKAPRKGCRVLVLSPTRELSSQIAESFRMFSAGSGFSVATVFGGVSYERQIRALARGVDILVATAGRLVDLIDRDIADLRSTEILVLDEVDQMLDLGFVKPIRRIVRDIPIRRQSLFFSATMPNETRTLANELLVDPVEVAVTPVSSTVERIDQKIILVEAQRKRDILVNLFEKPDMNRVIVFTRTKHGADRVASHLERAGISAQSIHGNKSQGQRERALSTFRSGGARALVATDIAARGIDIDRVSHVINYELPEIAERYVHRIGRTARAGADGIAISLCDSLEKDLLRDIEKLISRKLPFSDMRNEETRDAEELQSAKLAATPKKKGTARHKMRKKTPSPGKAPVQERKTVTKSDSGRHVESRRNAKRHPAAHKMGIVDSESGTAPLRRRKSA